MKTMYLVYELLVNQVFLVECSVVGAHGQTRMPHFQPGTAPSSRMVNIDQYTYCTPINFPFKWYCSPWQMNTEEAMH